MSRFYKTQLAEMTAMMKRMDSHFTTDEAKRFVLNESGKNGLHLKPSLRMEKIRNTNNEIFLYVGVAPVWGNNRHMAELRRNFPNSNKIVLDTEDNIDSQNPSNAHLFSNQGKEEDRRNLGIVLCAKITPVEKNNKDNGGTEDVNFESGDDLNLDDFDFGTLNEDTNFDDLFGDLLGDTNGGEGVDDVQFVFDGEEVTNKQEMMDWFENQYMKLINLFYNTNKANGAEIYDEEHLRKLGDISWVYNMYLSTPEKNDRLTPDSSMSEMKSKVLAYLQQNGNVVEAFSNVFKAIDLLRMSYGRQFSPRNIHRITNQNPNAQHVTTAEQWLFRYGRKIKDNAQPVTYIANSRGINDKQTEYQNLHDWGFFDSDDDNTPDINQFDRLGSAASVAGENNAARNNFFATVAGYDYADTEPVTEDDPEWQWIPQSTKDALSQQNNDMLNNRPGAYNITGQLNSLGQADYDAKMAKKADSNNGDEGFGGVDVSNENGQAIIFNIALYEYSTNDLGMTTLTEPNKDINNPNALSEYIQNVVSYAISRSENMASKPENRNAVAYTIAAAICSYTVGAEQCLQYLRTRGIYSRIQWKQLFKEFGDGLMSDVYNAYIAINGFIVTNYKLGFKDMLSKEEFTQTVNENLQRMFNLMGI